MSQMSLVKDEGTTPMLRVQAAVQQKGGVVFVRNSISLSVLSASAANPLLHVIQLRHAAGRSSGGSRSSSYLFLIKGLFSDSLGMGVRESQRM